MEFRIHLTTHPIKKKKEFNWNVFIDKLKQIFGNQDIKLMITCIAGCLKKISIVYNVINGSQTTVHSQQ